MMILICIKQYLSNIWSSIHEKLSNSEPELKKPLLIKKCVSKKDWNFLFGRIAISRRLNSNVRWRAKWFEEDGDSLQPVSGTRRLLRHHFPDYFISLYEKIGTEFFWSVFSPNVGKCRPEKLQMRTLFMQWEWLPFSHA